MSDPHTLLFTNAATSIVVIVGTLTVLWMNGRFANHARNASLQATNAELIKRIADREADFNKREAASQKQIAELKTEREQHFSREAVLAKYAFEEPNGTYFDPVTKVHVCPFCIQQAQQVVSPMRDYGHGWHCPVCNKAYCDPKRPEPEPPRATRSEFWTRHRQ